MNRWPSTLRRILGVTVGSLAVVAWLAAVVVWTSTARVTSASGFADVTVETLQSPGGASVLTDALVAKVRDVATDRGYSLSSSAEADIRGQIEQVIVASNFPDVVGPAIERAREAYQAAPDGPIVLDFSALRVEAQTQVQAVDPDLVRFIPPDEGLTVIVRSEDVPPVASAVAGATDSVSLLPIWLLIATIVLGAVAFLVSPDRARTARRIGIAFLMVALMPLVMRLAVPSVIAAAVDGREAGDVAATAAVAVLANWWIALVVSAAAGLALIGASAWLFGGPARRMAPVVLGR